MSGSKFLLDTNIVIEVFKGNKAIADKINGLSHFYISPIVLGELYVGIYRVANKERHLRKLHNFLKLCTVIEIDSGTAKYYGQIVADLFKKGKPLSANDIWIAASVKQHQLTLISKDNHFKEIDKLNKKTW